MVYPSLLHELHDNADKCLPVLVVCGSTGESSMLSMEEHVEMINVTKELVNHRIKVIANCGANSTQEAIYLTQEAEKLGVDAVLPQTTTPSIPDSINHST